MGLVVERSTTTHWLIKELEVLRKERGVTQQQAGRIADHGQVWWRRMVGGQNSQFLYGLDKIAQSFGYEIELVKK